MLAAEQKELEPHQVSLAAPGTPTLIQAMEWLRCCSPFLEPMPAGRHCAPQ